jgi:phage pi2 protein 07
MNLTKKQLEIQEDSLFLNEFSKIIPDENFILYHLAYENHDGKIFKPRVPLGFDLNPNNNIAENKIWKRVCFSPDIAKCIRAIRTSYIYYGDAFYVHTIVDQEKYNIYKPTKKEVWDCEATDEYWLRDPVKLKCIGRVLVTGYSKNPDDYTVVLPNFENHLFIEYYPTYKYKWIERY